MELRLLTTSLERSIFTERVAAARAQSGVGYAAVYNEVTGNQHRLAACDLLGLFDHPGAAPDQMLGGMAVHNLEVYPQSCGQPDLTHLPPGASLNAATIGRSHLEPE